MPSDWSPGRSSRRRRKRMIAFAELCRVRKRSRAAREEEERRRRASLGGSLPRSGLASENVAISGRRAASRVALIRCLRQLPLQRFGDFLVGNFFQGMYSSLRPRSASDFTKRTLAIPWNLIGLRLMALSTPSPLNHRLFSADPEKHEERSAQLNPPRALARCACSH